MRRQRKQRAPITTCAASLFDEISNKMPELTNAWIARMFADAEAVRNAGLVRAVVSVDLDELEERFWDAWARRETRLSIINDVMYLFARDFPDAEIFAFDVCASPLQKKPIVEVTRGDFWTIRAGQCKENFAFTEFKGDALAPRETLALAVMRELYENINEFAFVTDDDAAFWGARLREALRRRSEEERDEFAKTLAKTLYETL